MKKLIHLLLMLAVSLTAYSQQRISGQVVDSKTGEPIIGATVLLKSKPSIGTATDLEGNFLLSVPSLNEIIKVSYVGYNPIELKAEGKMLIKLMEDSKALDEVVVIGYGIQRKADVTSSVASVKSENFVKGAVKDTTDSRQSGRSCNHQSFRRSHGKHPDQIAWDKHHRRSKYCSIDPD